MRIDFSEHNYLDVEIISYGDDIQTFSFAIGLCADEFRGKSYSEVELIDIKSFLGELAGLRETLRGEASLGVGGLSSCIITVKPVSSTGQFALAAVLRTGPYDPAETSLSHSFTFTTSQLDYVCDTFTGFFAAAGVGA